MLARKSGKAISKPCKNRCRCSEESSRCDKRVFELSSFLDYFINFNLIINSSHDISILPHEACLGVEIP